jgi:hypothetical protein
VIQVAADGGAAAAGVAAGALPHLDQVPERVRRHISGRLASVAVLAVANWANVPISTSATVSALATGTAADGQLPLVARLSRGNGADRDVPR